MTSSDSRRITDELLSAYIDDEVTEQERALIEAAIAQDQEIAWRLDSLRQTVTLLRDLPEITLPRSFALTVEQLQMAPLVEPLASAGASGTVAGQVTAVTPAVTPRLLPQAAPTRQVEAGFWQQLATGWRAFWQIGNPVLRNAAAISFALMLVFLGGGRFFDQTAPADSMVATAPEAAPAAASESVALVPPDATQSGTQRVQDGDQAPKAPAASADAEQAAAADSSESSVVEGPVPESGAAQAGEAAMADAAPTADTVEEPAVAAAMAAPEQEAGQPAEELEPVVEAPLAGPGIGGGGMGGAGGDAPPGGGVESGLVPEQAFEFDVDPLAEPTIVPAEEAVVASAAAAPAEEAAPQSAANMASTPAVDAVAAPEAEADSAAARSAAPADTPSTEGTVAEETGAPDTATEAAESEEPAAGEAVALPSAEPTAEAVALVAPEAITSSLVVEDTEPADVATATGYGLSLVTIAQGSALLLTVVFASLWWRSRTPRRPRP